MAKRREKGDGSIYLRESDGRYVAYVRLENGKKKYVYAKTRKEVVAKLKELQRKIAAGTLITAKPESVEAYLYFWIEHKKIKETTYHNYKNSIASVCPYIGQITLTKLTSDTIQKLYTALYQEKHQATGSILLTHRILKTAFRDAMKRKKMSSNPCDDVELPDNEKEEAQALDADQCMQLLDTAKGSALECFITFTLATAMRRGELIGLRWSDIDLDKKVVKVQRTASYLPDKTTRKYRYVETTPKSKSSRRTIPITEFALVSLRSHKIKQLETRLQAGTAWLDKDLVFPGSAGDYSPSSTIQYQFKKIVLNAGIPDICIHELRHSAATLLLKKGVDMKVIQKILGHANYLTTANIYGHVLMDMQEDAIHKMDDLFQAR